MAEVFLESSKTRIIVPDGFDPFAPRAKDALVWLANGAHLSRVPFADALLAGEWRVPTEPKTVVIGDPAKANKIDEIADGWDSWLSQIQGLLADS